MPLSVRVFNGKMNLDTHPYRVPNGDYVYAMNLTRDGEGDAQDDVVSNIKGNVPVVVALPTGINKEIGNKEDVLRNRLYYFIWNSGGYHTIFYYDGNLNSIVRVFQSRTDSGDVDILQLDPSEKITSINILPTNDGDIMSFIDSLKRPSQINIEKSINGYYGVWQRSFLDAAKEPPNAPPYCIFEDDDTVVVNNFKKRLLKFRTRFVYENNEKSVYSAESEIPLPYNVGNPDQDADPTKNARISIIIPTGALNVAKIELVVASSLGDVFGDYQLVDSLDKALLGIPDNDITTYVFYNDKAYPTVDITEILQPYDYVPKKANAQEMANGNTREYAGITEGYDRIGIDATAVVSLEDDTLFQYPTALLYAAQTENNIHVIILGAPQEGDVYEIVSTTKSFQYTAIAGDETSDVINGLLTDAVANGFSIISNDSNNLIVFQTNEVFDNYLFTPNEPVTFTDVTFAYDWMSKESFGLLYLDDKGRSIGGVLTSNALTVQMPPYTAANFLPKVTIVINHRPPIDATDYHIVRANDLAKKNILQWVSDRTFKDELYAYISIEALNQYVIDNPGTETQLGYSFTGGDRIRLIESFPTGALSVPQIYTDKDFEILSSVVNPMIGGLERTGQFLKIALPTTDAFFNFGVSSPLGVPVDFSNYFFELYTPAFNAANSLNVYYEFGERYRIINAGTTDRSHSGNTINQSADLSTPAVIELKRGDYYYRLRDINASNELKYILIEGDVGEIDYVPQTLEKLFDATGYTAQAQLEGHVSGNLHDSENWMINVTDGNSYTFHIKGTVTVKGVSNSSDSYSYTIYVVDNVGNTNTYDLFTIVPVVQDRIYTFAIDTTITVPATYIKVFMLGRSGPGFDGVVHTVSGSLTITDASKTFSLNIIDENFSDFYLSSVNNNGRSWAIEPNAKEVYNPVLIRFSREYDQDTSTNNLNRFYEDNFIECDRSNGDIQRLFIDGRNMYVFHKFNVGIVPVLIQVIIDNASNPLEANSDILLNKVQYPFSGKYGIGDATSSLAYGKGVIYFVDTSNKLVCAFARGADIQPISVLFQCNSFFVENLSAYRKDLNNGYAPSGGTYTGDAGLYGVFDKYTNKYILVMETINRYNNVGALIFHQDPHTIAFANSEKIKGFESFYSYHPDSIGGLGTLLITNESGLLLTHNSSTYCNFNSVQYDAYIDVVFNDVQLQKKNWQGVTEEANVIWDCPTISTQVNTFGTQEQQSRIPTTRFKLKSGQYHASFLRDTNSYGGLLNGTPLKGNWLTIRFRVASAQDFVFLNAVSLKYLNFEPVPQ